MNTNITTFTAGHAPDNLSAWLPVIAEQLAGPRRDLEPIFLDMGEHLLGCTKLLDKISVAHEGMPAELESADFQAAVQLLETIRKQVAEMAAISADEQTDIERLSAMAAEVSAPLAELHRAARTIRLITVNARVAAAYLSGQQIDVAAFTNDMTMMGNCVANAVSAFTDAYDRLSASLGLARETNAAFIAKHGDTLTRISGRLAGHLALIDEHRTRAKVRASRHGELTGQIRARIASAVGALQIGDISRQRVEHVEAALELLAGHLGNQGPGAVPTQTSAAICHLQADQLHDTLADFDHQIAGLSGSLRALAADATSVLDAGKREADALLSAGGTALDAIVGDLGDIGILFADFGKTRNGLEQAATDVANSVVVMLDHLDAIGEVEHQILLLSLNTTIHCSRLSDDGSALRVIAQDLRELAQQTVAAAGAIMTGLSEADKLARNLTDGRSQGIGDEIAVLERDAEAAIGMFKAVVSRLRDRATTMVESGPRALRQLEAAADRVSKRSDFVAAWREAQIRISALASLAPEMLDTNAIDAELFSELRGRYTMDSERQLHDTLLGVPVELRSTTGAQSTAEAELDDIFF